MVKLEKHGLQKQIDEKFNRQVRWNSTQSSGLRAKSWNEFRALDGTGSRKEKAPSIGDMAIVLTFQAHVLLNTPVVHPPLECRRQLDC